MKRYAWEFVGTALLVFMGCGCAVYLAELGGLGVALAFGLTLMALIYTIGGVSGCHVNPAVSLAMLLDKRMKLADFFGYVLAQFVGAIAGAGLLVFLYDGAATGLGSNSIPPHMDVFQALMLEFVLTFIFVLVIMRVTANAKLERISGVIIGLTLAAVHLLGMYMTGTSVNPARSLGPALLYGGEELLQVWVFLVAPLAGGGLAGLLSGFLDGEHND